MGYLLCRFIGIFRFICDHVFGPFPQRAYADPCEKWQLVVACLQHFHMWVYQMIFFFLKTFFCYKIVTSCCSPPQSQTKKKENLFHIITTASSSFLTQWTTLIWLPVDGFQSLNVHLIGIYDLGTLFVTYHIFLWKRILSMYNIQDEDIDSVMDQIQISSISQPSPLQMQLPLIELLKVCVYCCWLCFFPYTVTIEVSLLSGLIVLYSHWTISSYIYKF